MLSSSEIAILTVAGGRGTRAGEGLPKQYRRLLGQTLLARTLEALFDAAPNALQTVVIHADDQALYDGCVAELRAEARARLTPPAPFTILARRRPKR